MNDYRKKDNIAFEIYENCEAKRSDFTSLDNIETTRFCKSVINPCPARLEGDFGGGETFQKKEDEITSFLKNKIAITDHQKIPFFSNPGEILNDSKYNWRDFKLKSISVSDVLEHEKRAERMSFCGSSLLFGINSKNEKKLINATFCKDRMCPSCQKRRSLTIFHQLSNVCKLILNDKNVDFLFLTLTVKNVDFALLDATIKKMMTAFNKLTKYKIFKDSILGFFRALEVTYNSKRDDYHPHFHVLLCVDKRYFKDHYISHSNWLELWQKANNDYSITQVDIRKVKANKRRKSDNITSVVAEVGKYATKPSDYLKKGVDGLYIADRKVVNELMLILKNKRLIAYGGILKDYYKKLSLIDVEESDLINVDNKKFEAVNQQFFVWNVGFNNYISK